MVGNIQPRCSNLGHSWQGDFFCKKSRGTPITVLLFFLCITQTILPLGIELGRSLAEPSIANTSARSEDSQSVQESTRAIVGLDRVANHSARSNDSQSVREPTSSVVHLVFRLPYPRQEKKPECCYFWIGFRWR